MLQQVGLGTETKRHGDEQVDAHPVHSHKQPSACYSSLLLVAAGAYAFVMLGRAEDPSFTINLLTVTTVWPGATAREMQDLVAEPLEKRLQELTWYDRVETTAARLCLPDGHAEGQHAAICRAGGVLPGPQEARR